MSVNTRWIAVALPLSLLGAPVAGANPLSETADTKEASYASPFEGYVNDEDLEAGGWVAANQRVGEIGGWRTYSRQALEPTDSQQPSDLTPGTMPHGDHESDHSKSDGAR